jgi:hypothetical protein
MGFGAAKPGSTLPPQGGKAQPTNTLQPGAQIFNGTVTPNTIGPNGLPVGGTMPAGYNGPIPSQGGKFPGNPQQPTTSNIPGYAQPYVNALNPQVQQPAMVDPAMVAQIQAAYKQPGQVPAQGGKTPFTPEQQAAFGPYISPARPQVLPPQGQSVRNPQSPITPYGPEQLAFLQEKMQGQPTRPQVFPAQPQVMPRLVPQVMPRQPTPRPTMTRPSSIGAGLAALRGRR